MTTAMDSPRKKPHRSCLSVPGSSARMQAKAATLAADQVLLDLEDATAPSEKVGARQVIVESLLSLDFGRAPSPSRQRRGYAVVLSGRGRSGGARGRPHRRPDSSEGGVGRRYPLRRPAAERIELARGWPVGRIGLEVLIESPQGLQQVDAIASASPRLRALIFGPGDLSASLGLGQLTIGMHDDSGYGADIWHYSLMRLLVAARVNGLLAIDGPFAAFADWRAWSDRRAERRRWASTASG